jgi:CDP-glycerol glycerophosphotransferase (TagB/SpsB family)
MSLKYICLLVKWFLYLISYFFLRDKNLWAFGSRKGQFVDNPKYLFLHICTEHKYIECVWISSDKSTVAELCGMGLNAYYKWSFLGVWKSLRAAYFIYAFDSDDINFHCSASAKLINLYHGLPLKKIEFDTQVGSSHKIYHPSSLLEFLRSKIIYAPKWQKIDVFQIPSSSLKEIHDSAFNHQIDKYVYGINPRLAPLVDGSILHDTIANDRQKASEYIKGYDKVWIYMPTWRQGSPDILKEAFPDLDVLNTALKKNNILLVLKMHLYSLDNIGSHSNISSFPAELDVYPFLSVVDLLITDYSSIAFDFALIKGNTIFYAYDLERYLATASDGFYFDYEAFSNALKVEPFDQLINIIESNDISQFCLGASISSAVWGKYENIDFFASNENLVSEIKNIRGLK